MDYICSLKPETHPWLAAYFLKLSGYLRADVWGKRLFLCVTVQSCILLPPRLTDRNSPYILTCVTHITKYLISSENVLDVIVLLLFTTNIK